MKTSRFFAQLQWVELHLTYVTGLGAWVRMQIAVTNRMLVCLLGRVKEEKKLCLINILLANYLPS